MNLNPSSALATLMSASATAGTTGDGIFRGRYTEHIVQVVGSSGAVNFTLYTSTDTSTWTAIRDQTDVDTTAQAYDNTTPNGVIVLSGCYPWLQVARGTGATGSTFSATVYSTGNPED